MFNFFGKGKTSKSDGGPHNLASNDIKSKYSIQLDSKGKILFISFGLKEYFLIYDVYDVTQVFPENLSQLSKTN